MEHVIALDPGQRTGWASARMDTDHFELTGTGVLRQEEMAAQLAEFQLVRYVPDIDLRNYAEFRMYDVIVAESWRPRRDESGNMDWIERDPLLSAQHLGQIRLIAQLSHAKYVEYQPSQKEFFLARMPANLRALDDDSNEQHDQDARMHLWGYFWQNWFSAKVKPETVVRLPDVQLSPRP